MTDDETTPIDDLIHMLGEPESMSQSEDGSVTSITWGVGSLQKFQDRVQTDMMSRVETLQHPDKNTRLLLADTRNPVCVGCGRFPEEIPEYVYQGKINECSPTEFVQEEEGTFNRENGHYACDECYLAMGSPSSPRGWKAP